MLLLLLTMMVIVLIVLQYLRNLKMSCLPHIVTITVTTHHHSHERAWFTLQATSAGVNPSAFFALGSARRESRRLTAGRRGGVGDGSGSE